MAEIQAKREKGLCFRCSEKYTAGHRCKSKQLFYIEGEDEELEGKFPTEMEEEPATGVEISMHALQGKL